MTTAFDPLYGMEEQTGLWSKLMRGMFAGRGARGVDGTTGMAARRGKMHSRRGPAAVCNAISCVVQELERRVLLSSFDGGRLEITGTANADNLTIAADANGNVTLGGSVLDLGNGLIATSSLRTIVIDALEGDDTVDLSQIKAYRFKASGMMISTYRGASLV